MTATLKNSAFALNQAIENSGHCTPGSVIIRDGHHNGNLFTWLEKSTGDRWCIVDLDTKGDAPRYVDRIAVVTLEPDGDEFQADRGLNQANLGIDLEVDGGEWVIDRDDVEGLKETYGDNLVVIWEQE